MNIHDLLITTSQSDQQFSACLRDYNTENVLKHYKNGGSIAPNCFELLGKDYFLSAELGKPLLHLWLLNSQDIVKNVRLILPEPANCLAICPENIFLAVGINCKIYVWHLSSGKLVAVQQKNYQPITCVKFSSDSTFLLIGGQDGMLINYCLTDLVSLSGNFLLQTDIGKTEPFYIKRDHSLAIKDIHIGKFGKKSRFSTVSVDRTCRIYNILNGELLINLVFEDCLSSVIFDSWFGSLYVGMDSGNIRLFNLKEPPKTLTHHTDETSNLIFNGHTNRVVCLALNTSETILASGSLDCFVYTWDVKKRQLLKKFKHGSPITNVKFVVSFPNFFAENIKPQVVVKSLERSLITDAADLVVTRLQNEEIEVDEADFKLGQEEIIKESFEENMKLRAVNAELYATAVLLNKKVHMLGSSNQ